jgi:alpha-galactosidase
MHACRSDDCWMMKNRSDNGAGPEQPQPSKFPQGVKHVADYIKSKGMQLGLYTTRANRSCGGYAGSCGHEFVDVQQWAAWGVTYMKDDSCGSCNRPVEQDYRTMQDAIRKVGKPMILTIEGGPNISEVSTGCCGQARRVGHDISADWVSMISLVDQASGLWVYAHNGSRSTVQPAQGFWNDLVRTL